MGCFPSSKDAEIKNKIKNGEIIKTYNFDNLGLLNLNELNNCTNVIDMNVFSAQRNKLTSLPQKFFRKIKRIVKLDVSDNDFEEIDQVIFDKISLTSINFSNNKISVIANEILGLVKLREFLISHNMIQNIPDCVKNLESLEVLDVSYNNISIMSETVLELPHLTTLLINNNVLQSLPSEKWNRSQIRKLDLGYNQLNEIPENLMKSSEVSALNLKGNKITKSQLRNTEGFEEFEKRRKLRKDKGFSKNLDISFSLCGLD